MNASTIQTEAIGDRIDTGEDFVTAKDELEDDYQDDYSTESDDESFSYYVRGLPAKNCTCYRSMRQRC